MDDDAPPPEPPEETPQGSADEDPPPFPEWGQLKPSESGDAEAGAEASGEPKPEPEQEIDLNPSAEAESTGPTDAGGASDLLDEDEIARLLTQAQNPQEAAQDAPAEQTLELTPKGEDTDADAGSEGGSDLLGEDEIAALLRANTEGTEASSEVGMDRLMRSKEEIPDDPDAPEEVLDQSSIDMLMNTSGGEVPKVILKHTGERFPSEQKVTLESYDFSNPVFMTEMEMRQVRIRHEQFIHHLCARLSMFLRMDFGLKMARIDTAHYKKYTESIPNPTHISLFKLEQFGGVGIVDMNPRLAMTIVDRLLGGAGHSIREERYLTELERVLIEDVIAIVLEEWCRQWEDMFELNASIVGAESNGRFLETSPHDAIMLVLMMEATVGDCSELMQIGIPTQTIEPIVRKMQQEAKKYNGLAGKERSHRWWRAYDPIGVPVAAEWPAFDCTLRDLLSLRAGDVIVLPSTLIEATQVRFHNNVQFLGTAGIQDGRVCVEIKQPVKQAS